MTERAFLGEFEHLVLATALRLRDGYGAELVRELEVRTGRQVQGVLSTSRSTASSSRATW
jgi:hypothetical protein